ncbi:DUF4159 domain-containing protein [Candidatus Caldipriscus sp.]|nr:DUF4159 domain-containing protein [Candidatus Caldipriscus sp.]
MIFLISLLKIARVEYEGGDWYNDPEILPNITKEFNSRVYPIFDTNAYSVRLSLPEIYEFVMLFITGHGSIRLSEDERKNLRKYLENGGFLYVDDDYGLDSAFRREIKEVFPEYELVEIPNDHPIFKAFYEISLPKVHEHYPGPPKAYGIFIRGRLAVFYTWNSNISDGWTDKYNDPPEIREKAIRMGINILYYALIGI